MATNTRGPVVVVDPSCGSTLAALIEAWRSRELLLVMVTRDIAVRYRQTLLGVAWAVVVPILSMAVYTLFFGILARVGPEGIPYPVFLFPALVMWHYFNSCVGRTAQSLSGSVSLVSKVYFPRLLLPFSSVLSPLMELAFTLLVLTGLLVGAHVLGAYPLQMSWKVALLPAYLLLAMCGALGAGLWLAGFNAHYRDVQQVLPVLLHLWFFCTPILYPVDIVAEHWRTVYAINPMVTVTTGFREALVGLQGPTPEMVTMSVTVVLFLLVGGLIVFNRLEKTIADVL